ncbi:MAG: helix-turn-helix domain-containing protein [Bacteroidales bacterium]|nr:helix-turn-helix domain-containing protein [Bacteroidales bacterium]
MHFTTNIRLLRKRLGRTQDDIATALKMKRSTLSGYENGVSEPNLEAIIALSEYFGVAIDTLVKKDLSTLSNNQLIELEKGYNVFIKGSKLRVLATTVDSENNENIELVNEKAKAGYTTGFADPEYISELPKLQLPFMSRNKKYRTFQVSGDSMLPIPDKAFVTGEFVQDWTFLKKGDACIILTLDDGIVFKILGNPVSKHRHITLFSLNPQYKPFEIDVKDIREIWKFANYISMDMPDPVLHDVELHRTVANLQQEMYLLKDKLNDHH